MVLPPYNDEVVRVGMCPEMVQCPKMGEGFFEMFLVSLPKGLRGLTYVFIITYEPPTLIPID